MINLIVYGNEIREVTDYIIDKRKFSMIIGHAGLFFETVTTITMDFYTDLNMIATKPVKTSHRLFQRR